MSEIDQKYLDIAASYLYEEKKRLDVLQEEWDFPGRRRNIEALNAAIEVLRSHKAQQERIAELEAEQQVAP